MGNDAVPLEIPVTEAKRILDENPGRAVLLDVREPVELQICSVAGATPVPMQQVPGQLSNLPRDKYLLVLCHHGGRSLRVTQFLRANGFTEVSNVCGGIDAWAEQIEPGMARY